MISDSERQQLSELIGKTDCQDNTEFIRKTKPSSNIMKDVRRLEVLSKEQETLRLLDPENYLELCKKECPFLYTHYTEIFNKLLKDELDLTIMAQFVMILKMIEDKKVDQHEGSVLVGKILKELYLDAAIKRSDKLDKQYESEKPKQVEPREISWKQYRKMKL